MRYDVLCSFTEDNCLLLEAETKFEELWLKDKFKENNTIHLEAFHKYGVSRNHYIGLKIKAKSDACDNPCPTLRKENNHQENYECLYRDLIYCIATKYPGETRHKTAKRYLLEREFRISELGQKTT